MNGGVCVPDPGAARCNCLAGWEGDSCQLNHDDCQPNPCMNGGTCTDGVASFSCACGNGFTGASCSDPILATCKAILQTNPAAPSGDYLVDPDGIGVGEAPFETVCDMSQDGGGWTLVGRELVGHGGTFKFLNLNSGDPGAAALGEGSALVGVRFSGLYGEVRLNWSGESTGFIRFAIAQDMFADTVNTSIPITQLLTSDAKLASWSMADGGAVLCRASSYSQVRPGDTSWAIKPQADSNTTCGCNSSGWVGRGAFYGGQSDATECNPGGGSWAAVRDNGEQKGWIFNYGLDIWVR
ncbi:MAG TPA: fibrinogen-like YCDxxxxGGGW domain-containing protein [Polyangiaceae bacterium]